MIQVRIAGTGSALPSRKVSTLEVAILAYPERDPQEMVERTGIDTRHWLGPGETAAGLAAEALKKALSVAGMAASDLRRVVLVTSTGGDHRIPATANGVAEALGLDDSCDMFDLNNSCAGFLSGFDVGARSVATGLGPTAIVSVEVFSRHTSPEGRRAFMILGDAAAAVVLTQGQKGEGILASRLRNMASLRSKMWHPLEERPDGKFIIFDATNEELSKNALDAMRRSTASVMEEAALGPMDFDWFLPHQPNGRMLEFITGNMGIPAEKLVPVVGEIGSVGSAAVPSSLDRLMRTRPVRPGHRILMVSVGAGTAYGATLYQVAS